MFNPLDYKEKTQETLLLGITHYDELIDWCNDNGNAYKAFHLLEVFFDRDDILEKIISKNSEYSYYFARYVLDGPFALGEEVISRHIGYAYMYATDVLKGPFPLGEEIISRNEEYAFCYAKDVLKGPFLLGEEAISKNPKIAYYYAIGVLKGPFILGEEAILNSMYKDDYLELINQ